MNKLFLIIGVLTSLTGPLAYGNPDREADSRLTISLSILPSLSIDNISDVQFDIERRDIDANYDDQFCVRGNSSTRYSILAYGSSSNQSGFFLTNAEGDSLKYTVAFRGRADKTQYDQLAPGEASPVYSVLPANESCGTDSNFNIRFLAADLEAAESGLYSGALTLVVAPV